MKRESRLHLDAKSIVRIIAWILAVILIVGLAVLELRSMVQIEELSSRLAYLQDTADVIQMDVNNMETNIEATLEQEASLMENWSVSLVGVDFEQGTYDLEVSLIPKNYTDTMTTSIFFGTSEFLLQREGYTYHGVATLPMDTVYDGNVTVLFADGAKKSTELLRNYEGVQSMVSHMLSGTIAKEPIYRDGTLTLGNSFSANLDGNGRFQFQKFLCVVNVDGQDVYAYDLFRDCDVLEIPEGETALSASSDAVLAELESGAEMADVNADDSKNTDTVEDEDSDGADSAAEQGPEVTTGVMKPTDETTLIAPDEMIPVYPSLSKTFDIQYSCNVAESAKVRIYLMAVTEEGYRFEYDLFNAYTNESGNGFAEASSYYIVNYYWYDDKGYAWTLK